MIHVCHGVRRHRGRFSCKKELPIPSGCRFCYFSETRREPGKGFISATRTPSVTPVLSTLPVDRKSRRYSDGLPRRPSGFLFLFLFFLFSLSNKVKVLQPQSEDFKGTECVSNPLDGY